jgi:DHA1 family bicyclomycin/chloramphenicol resistance-like MFS transporter
MITLASITLIGPLAIHMFLPVLPVVKSAFEMPEALAGLTFSITLFVMGFATLVYGSLSDRYGRRPVLLWSLGLFVAGSVASAVATSAVWLLAGRVLQAAGAGGGATLARAIARDAFGTERLVKAIAHLQMAYALGPMLAPLAGGLMLDASGWRGVFWLAFAIGLVISAAAYAVLHETHEAEHRTAGGNVLRDYARLFAHLRFTAYVSQSGFSTGTFFAMGAASAFLMKDYLGRSASEFGAYFMLFPVGFVTGNFLSGKLSQRFSVETMVLAGASLNMVASAVQAVLMLTGHVTPLAIFVPGMLTTLGQGLALPNGQVGAIRVEPSLAGTASGISVFFQMFLGAVFAEIYTVLADGTPVPMVITCMTASALSLATGIVPYAMRARPIQPA